MKTETKESKPKESAGSSQEKEIKTDMPLSEKDEVKDAEKRTRKASKDNS
jgi:hypothetical protein